MCELTRKLKLVVIKYVTTKSFPVFTSVITTLLQITFILNPSSDVFVVQDRTYITSVSVSRPIGSLTQEENKNLLDMVFIRVISATSISVKKKGYFSNKDYKDKDISDLVFSSYFTFKIKSRKRNKDTKFSMASV